MSGTKQFEPTKKRLEKARADGDVAKSREFTIGFSGLVSAVALSFAAPGMARRIEHFYELSLSASTDFHTNNMLVSLRECVLFAACELFPLLTVFWLACLLAELMQVGLVFSWDLILWKWSRVSFFSGLKKVCGFNDESPLPLGFLYEAGKCLALLASTIAIAALALQHAVRDLALADLNAGAELGAVFVWSAKSTLLPISAVVLIIGTGDWLNGRLKRNKRLRMDLEDMKREVRESEGDGETKAMRKQLHQELLTQGILEGVRKANVIVIGRRET